jgi:hypothetical protein
MHSTKQSASARLGILAAAHQNPGVNNNGLGTYGFFLRKSFGFAVSVQIQEAKAVLIRRQKSLRSEQS